MAISITDEVRPHNAPCTLHSPPFPSGALFLLVILLGSEHWEGSVGENEEVLLITSRFQVIRIKEKGKVDENKILSSTFYRIYWRQ